MCVQSTEESRKGRQEKKRREGEEDEKRAITLEGIGRESLGDSTGIGTVCLHFHCFKQKEASVLSHVV